MMWILIIVISAAVLALSYWALSTPNKYWTDRGVQQTSPSLFFGDSWGTITNSQSLAELLHYIYNIHPNSRYTGLYQFMLPTLLLRDPDLIKQITVKDFDHFVDHHKFFPEDIDPLWSKNLFSLTGQKWRDMRSTLSPAFTSSKMKYMFSLISDNAQRFVKHFDHDTPTIEIEMKDTFTRFANDVIASTAFGIEVDSHKNRDNEFYLMGKEATNFASFKTTMKFLGYFFFPGLSKFFKVTLFSTQVANFFTSLIKQNIDSRERQGIARPDMLQLLLEARKNGLKYEESTNIADTGFATVEESDIGKPKSLIKAELTDTDITAQALIFFFAGFDSVSALMCFLSHELAINPDVQEKLIQEVDQVQEACKGKLTYEALLGMKYMDMVVSESLRKWPSVVSIDRMCTKRYTIQPELPGEKPVHIEKNGLLWFPVLALHRDEKYFPNPDKFDPERFSDENKGNIVPYSYIPFGSGPRNCIGSRFALLETKALFFHILSTFEIVPIDKTEIPLILNKNGFNLTAKNGFWLGLKRRVKS